MISLVLRPRRPLASLNVRPSKVHALHLGITAERSVNYFGPSEVRALPLGVAAEKTKEFLKTEKLWDKHFPEEPYKFNENNKVQRTL